MSLRSALFIDLRPKGVEHWPDGDFAIAYIVAGDMAQTQDFFKTHYKSLPAIPHITVEITDADTLHL